MVDLETCVHKIKAMKVAVPTQEEERCRACTKEYEFECTDYLPVSRTELNVRHGMYAETYLMCSGSL